MQKLILMLFLIAVLSMSTRTTHAQPSNFLWAVQAGGVDPDQGYDIATDGSGNYILTGQFEGIASFGDSTLSSSLGSLDIFIAKINSDGNFLWAVKAGGTNSDEGYGITTDGFGNCIVTGRFEGTATFGDSTLSSSQGSRDIFISKINSDGNFLWAVRAGGVGSDEGYGIATDASGNCIVTGRFEGTATFGDSTLSSSQGSRDIFITKITSDGNFQWAVRAGGVGSDEGLSISTDVLGNSIVSGRFSNTATFGDSTLSSLGSREIFVTKINSDGNFLWAVRAGGIDFDEGKGVATDVSGNIIVTGWFTGTATFGDSTLSSVVGSRDIFITKINSDGNFLWAKKAGGWDVDEGKSISTDGSDNIIVTGRFEGTATFGDTTNLTSAGGRDIFIAKYNGDGNFLWVTQAGGIGLAEGFGISTDGSGNSIVTGRFEGTATFGDSTLGSSLGSRDIFIAKLSTEITGIEEELTILQSFKLFQNYPNPFNPVTIISYRLAKTNKVILKIYDINGREIKTLVNQVQNSGEYSIDFDASDLASGLYIYNLKAGSFKQSRKMLLLR